MTVQCYVSGLLQNLQQVSWDDQTPLCIFGDMAYPLSVHLQTPYSNPRLTQEQKDYNTAMSTSVVWVFGEIKNFFKFIDYKKTVKTWTESNWKTVFSMWIVT